VVEHADGITPANAAAIFADYDIVVDGTDNFSARYLNNDAAHFARKPLVFGSVFKFEGQVSVFDTARGGPCYRCLFPEPPAAGSVPGCGEAGVLGALCGVIGSLQALETIKLITGAGAPLRGRLLTYDALTQNFRTLTLARDASCPLCGRSPTIRAVTSTSRAEPPAPGDVDHPLEVTVAEAGRLLAAPGGRAVLIDVREPWETEICRLEAATFIPMRRIPEQLPSLPRDRHLLILCHHGGRSRMVTEYLRAQGFTAVSNIAGGIEAWAGQLDPSLARY
jgi:adenylyltransferase/sulfurtransferase